MQKAGNQGFNQPVLAHGLTSTLAETAIHEHNSWKEKKLFLVNFFKNPLRNASVIPSSKFAGNAILYGLDWEKINTIVELGPGSGTFTSEIIARCKPDAKLILIELEGSFVELLRNKFGSRVNVIHDGAHRMNLILEELNLPKADLIVSSLPFLNKEISREIFAGIKYQTHQGGLFPFFYLHAGCDEMVLPRHAITQSQFCTEEHSTDVDLWYQLIASSGSASRILKPLLTSSLSIDALAK